MTFGNSGYRLGMADRSAPRSADGKPGRAPPTETIPLDQWFRGAGSLAALRSAVAAHGSRLGLRGERLEVLVVIAHELAANAIRHAGGGGRLRVWADAGAVHCEVADRGQGMENPDGYGWHTPPPAGHDGGRGLFFVRRLADSVSFHNTGSGMVITAAVRLVPATGRR
jgi:anti-sigma regulatory factor (Ser/Thr protein kinase)